MGSPTIIEVLEDWDVVMRAADALCLDKRYMQMLNEFNDTLEGFLSSLKYTLPETVSKEELQALADIRSDLN